MIPTATIHAALEQKLRDTNLLDRVSRSAMDDLATALSALRDSSESHAILIPGPMEITHETLEDDNTPLRAEVRSSMSLILTGQNPERIPQGGEDMPMADDILHRLMWADLSIPGLLLFPLAVEPVRIEFDGGASRDAFRFDLEARYHIQH